MEIAQRPTPLFPSWAEPAPLLNLRSCLPRKYFLLGSFKWTLITSAQALGQTFRQQAFSPREGFQFLKSTILLLREYTVEASRLWQLLATWMEPNQQKATLRYYSMFTGFGVLIGKSKCSIASQPNLSARGLLA